MKDFVFRHTKPTELEYTFRLKKGTRAKVSFVGARSARDGNGLFGLYATQNVETARCIIGTEAFAMKTIVMSAHENDAKFVKKTLGIDIDDKTKTAYVQVQDLKLKEEIERLTTENAVLTAKVGDYEVEVATLKAQIAGGTIPSPEASKEPEAKNSNTTDGDGSVDENGDDKPETNKESKFSDEEIKALKSMDIESLKNFKQLEAIAGVYRITGAQNAQEFRTRLSELKASL